MTDRFHTLPGFVELPGPAALAIERARRIHDAALQSTDYTILRVGTLNDAGKAPWECIEVELECHGVPPKNAHGIRLRERFLISVSPDDRTLVKVLALRCDFPTLIHQNDSAPDGPADLCLYFEPPSAVLRTWTPQSFLRRIAWWVEKSSKDALHPADQPVEQLFFASPFELVVPWNFDDLVCRPDQQFFVTSCGPRPDTRETFAVLPAGPDRPEKALSIVRVVLPKVAHGRVERLPKTLGQLSDTLSGRGVGLIEVLNATVASSVGTDGTVEKDSGTILLLSIPISRSGEGEVERLTHIAFYVQAPPLQLGALTGALFHFQGKYYVESGLGRPDIAPTWRTLELVPLHVLRFNDPARARAQSGITEPGPSGAVLGVGALGSTILDLWSRSGWGSWTAIDSDHIKPHNLVRHRALAADVGRPKAETAARLHDAVAWGASSVTAVVADATDFSNPRVRDSLAAVDLVVDATTTLEYPRLASSIEGLPRHMSVFVTPNGNAAVLLAEDQERSIRLRTLEAQYYRALIEGPVGEHHLKGAPATFWSGAGCRDISVVMPYSRISAHASLLAEQIQTATRTNHAIAKIWSRDQLTGEVRLSHIHVRPDRAISLGKLSVFIDGGLEEKLRGLREAGLPGETGGALLGYFDFNLNLVALVDALPAPPDSQGSTSYFERGVEGLAAAVAEAGRRTAGVVGYVGEWHSHPRAHSARPSRQDLYQLGYLALELARDGVPAVSLIVGEADIQVLAAESLS